MAVLETTVYLMRSTNKSCQARVFNSIRIPDQKRRHLETYHLNVDSKLIKALIGAPSSRRPTTTLTAITNLIYEWGHLTAVKFCKQVVVGVIKAQKQTGDFKFTEPFWR